MIYTPFNYQQINAHQGTHNPSSMRVTNNYSYAFWERSLFQRACSVIDLKNLPESWTGNIRDFLYYCLYKFGFVAVLNRPQNGLIFQPCTLYGFDLYYQPTNALITNPAIRESLDLKIGDGCELVKLTPDYMGIWDIIGYYAGKLSSMDSTVDMSIINSKLAYILGAKNKQSAETLKKIIDKVNKGEPAVFYDKAIADDGVNHDTPFQLLEMTPVKDNYILDKLLQDSQSLLNSFDSEIGIPTVPYQKKERMVTDEAQSRVIDSQSRATIWIETLNSSLDNVNRHYGTNIVAELRYTAEREGANNGEVDTMGT